MYPVKEILIAKNVFSYLKSDSFKHFFWFLIFTAFTSTMDKFLHGDGHKRSHGSNHSSKGDGDNEFESTGMLFLH